MNARIKVIFKHELMVLRRNKMIVGAMLFLPLCFVGTAVFSLVAIKEDAEDILTSFISPPALAHLTPVEALLVLMNDTMMLMHLMLPVILPTAIAAYSIVGEKRERSLEPLLSTPITEGELLFAKALAAILPAVAVGWFAFAVNVVAVYAVCGGAVALEAARPMWLAGVLLLAPMLASISTWIALIASSRFKDVRSVEAVCSLGVLPLSGVMIWVLMKQVYLTMSYVLLSSLVLLVVNVLLFKVTVRLFGREKILTSWR